MSTNTSSIAVGTREVGHGQPCFLMAEIGINHNGDMVLAKEMIDAAIESGADAVKFQNYRTEDFISDHALTLTYSSQGKEVTEAQFSLFKRCELSTDNIVELADYVRSRNAVFCSTPTNKEGVEILKAARAPLLKNGSDYLGNVELISDMARSGLPTVLSTGMATVADIDDAVRAFREQGGQSLVLLHCVSSYPAPVHEMNLRRIASMREAFGCPVGLSDHSPGIVAALVAVGLGACMIEKHFTTDRALSGPDHHFSSTPEEFAQLRRGVREAEQSLGSAVIAPTQSELEGRAGFRLSCVASERLSAGTRLSRDSIAYRRPGSGLAPGRVKWLLGRTLARDVDIGHVFQPDDFQ